MKLLRIHRITILSNIYKFIDINKRKLLNSNYIKTNYRQTKFQLNIVK